MKDSFCCTVSTKNHKKVSPTVSAPLHLILQAPSPASHEWKKVPGVKRLCQLCHLTVDGQGVICKHCGLKAHMLCSNNGTYYPTSIVNALTIPTTTNNSKSSSNPTAAGTASIKTPNTSNHNNSFEPRIKKLLHVSIPVPPANSVTSDLSHSASTRLSSCGDYSIAASTAIVVGTTTVSTETPRSQSKTPEITITPGSGVVEEDHHHSERTQTPSDRESHPEPTDSGCAGLLDIDEGDGNGSSSGAVSESLSIIKRSESVPPPGVGGSSNNSKSGPNGGIRYVDGPLDGALYALVSPVKIKAPSSADSGISFTVDQMKDLDRLLNALVQDADSIPDVRPYHAREDSLPFTYGVSDSALLKHRSSGAAASGATDKSSPPSNSNYINRSHSHYATTSTPTPTNYSTPKSNVPYSAPPSTSNNEFHYGTISSTSRPTTSTPTYYQKVNQIDKMSRAGAITGSDTVDSSHSSRVHHLHLNLDRETPIRKESNHSHYSDSYSSSNYASPNRLGNYGANQQSTIYSSPQQQKQPPPSSSISFNNLENLYGSSSNGRHSTTGGSRFRSQSADGRSHNEDSDAWLARQMQRLQEKKARKYSVNNDWLAELKRALPNQTQASQEKPQSQSNESGNHHVIYNRPAPVVTSSSFSTPRQNQHHQQIYGRSNVSTPIGGYGYGYEGTGGGLYSSDDESEFDREVEREMFHHQQHTPGSLYGSNYNNRGRRVQRYHSENAYDRLQQHQTHQQQHQQPPRAPSAQSNISDMSMSMGSGIPGFPVCPPTPYLNRPVSPAKPPRSPKGSRRSINSPTTPTSPNNGINSINEWSGTNGTAPRTPAGVVPIDGSNTSANYTYASRNLRAQTPVNPQPVYMIESDVKFTRDLSNYWYKPNANREETISSLRFQPVGSFIIRNSNSFPGAYGLAVKANESSTSEDSVRHFLIEPTKYGVRLRGSAVEPVFGSLSALVYAHSIEPMALPTKLILATSDNILPASQSQSTTAHLLSQGAACQLLFLGVIGVECVTGDDGIARGINAVSGVHTPTVVSLRLSKQGLTLTDVYRQRFFRLHFPLSGISYAATDPSNRTISHGGLTRKIFAIIARVPSASENSCIVLAELEQEQPANAIVAFFQRVIAWQN